MEEKKMFTEKESLELISQMIQMTKENLERGSGNVFLIYGYAAVALSVVVYAAVYITGRPLWNALWFLMFIPAIVMKVLQVRTKIFREIMYSVASPAIKDYRNMYRATFSQPRTK